MRDAPGTQPGPGRSESATDDWEQVSVSVEDRAFEAIASPPHAGGDDRPTRRVLPARPHLATDADGTPRLSVTMLLERQPRPSDESIRPLVERGVVQFESTLAVPEAVRRSVGCEFDTDVEQVYADPAEFALLGSASGGGPDGQTSGDGQESSDGHEADDGQRGIASAVSTGTGATASLNATVDRENALAVLDALHGRETPLSVRADVTFKNRTSPRKITIRGEWAAIYDHLVEQAPEDGFTRSELRNAFDSLEEAGVLDVSVSGSTESEDTGDGGRTPPSRRSLDDERDRGRSEQSPSGDRTRPSSGSGEERPPGPGDRPRTGGGEAETRASAGRDAAFAVFLDRSGLILRRETGGDGEEPTFHLGSRPLPGTTLSVTETRSPASTGTKRVAGPLHELFDTVLTGADVDAVLSVVSVGNDGRSAVDVAPDRIETRSAFDARSNRSPTLAATDDGVSSVSHLTAPNGSVTPSPRTMGLLQADQSLKTAVEDVHELDEKKSMKRRNLPVIEDTDAPLWPDRWDESRRWYLPELVPVDPSGTDDPAEAPFRFTFERTGTTPEGEPGLRATLRIELEERMSDETAEALDDEGDPQADPVLLSNHRVALELPFVDENGEQTTRRFSADVTENPDGIVAEWTFRNDWVRLSYGALALPDFQDQSTALVTQVMYGGYKRLEQKQQQQLTVGNKAALTQIREGEESVESATYFDAADATLHTGAGTFQFDREADSDTSDDGISGEAIPSPDLTGGGLSGGGLAGRNRSRGTNLSASTSTPVLSENLTFRPKFESQALEEIRPQAKYVVRSFSSTQRSTVSYPCPDFGTLYRERTDDETAAVGCRDAFALGQTDSALYAELTDLRTDRYSVHQMVAQPDRFLVVPTTYRIARRAPGTAREYKPSAVLYAVLNASKPEASKIVFEAGLQPDIPAYDRARLRTKLADYTPDPVVEYPTDVLSGATYTWTISRSVSNPVVVETADHLRVSVRTDLVDAHLLRRLLETSGVFGRATFELGDGSTVSSDVAMELGRMAGPWTGGPIESDSVATGVRLTNRVGGPVAVSALRTYEGDDRTATVPVEQTLSPDESTTVTDVPVDPEKATLRPVYEEQPGGESALEESRIYVEDVTTNVIFVVQFDKADRGVSSLDVDARLAGVDGTHAVSFSGDPPTGSVEFTLPLTTYLESHVVEFRVTARKNGERIQTDWRSWDLNRRGSIVNLTWDMIAPSRADRSDAAEESRGGRRERTDAPEREGSSDGSTGRPPSERRAAESGDETRQPADHRTRTGSGRTASEKPGAGSSAEQTGQ